MLRQENSSSQGDEAFGGGFGANANGFVGGRGGFGTDGAGDNKPNGFDGSGGGKGFGSGWFCMY